MKVSPVVSYLPRILPFTKMKRGARGIRTNAKQQIRLGARPAREIDFGQARVALSIEDDTHGEKETPEAVARGQADKTPAVAIGATAVIIAVVFALALGLAVLAYVLAG